MEVLVVNSLKVLAYAMFMVTAGFALITHRTSKTSDANDGCARTAMTVIGLGIGIILLTPAIRFGMAGMPATIAGLL